MPDTLAPQLTSLIIPNVVDVTDGPGSLTISGSVLDDTAVRSVVVYLSDDLTYSHLDTSTDYSTYAFLSNPGIYDSWSDGFSSQTYGISQINQPGTYTVSRVTVTDVAGNVATYSTADLINLGINTEIELVGAIPDDIPPSLIALNIQDSVDLSNGAGELTVSGTISDDLSGGAEIILWLGHGLSFSWSASSTRYNTFSLIPNFGSYDSWSDGTSSQTYGVSAENTLGVYHIIRVTIDDVSGNRTTLSVADLEAMGITTSIELVGAAVAAGEQRAVLTNADDFTVVEGQSTTFNLRFENLTNATFNYAYRFVTEDGSASASDYSGGVGSGSFSITSTSPQNRMISIPLSVLADARAEGLEVLYLEVELFGITFANGHTLQRFAISLVDNLRPTGEISLIGDAVENSLLTADLSAIFDVNGIAEGTGSLVWMRDGNVIAGATGLTYLLTDADVGSEITARYTYVDGTGITEVVNGPSSGLIANVNDLPAGDVLVTGLAQEGETLSADASGVLDEDGLGTFSYQWLRDGEIISGATSSSYQLSEADVDTTVTVRIIYLDGHGTEEEVTSGGVGVTSATDLNFVGTEIADVFQGGFGNDSAFGGAGNDTLSGGAHNDSLFGGIGNDILSGDAGDDLLDGGEGQNTLTGGLGEDVFLFQDIGASNVVTDFETGVDRIDLSQIMSLGGLVSFHLGDVSVDRINCFAPHSYDGLTIELTQSGENVEIIIIRDGVVADFLPPVPVIVLENVDLSGLSLSDFVL